MADTGDPRFAAPFWAGRYEVTPTEGVTFSSSTVMLTKTNVCQLCGDAEGVAAGTPFATLPEECRPARALHLSVCVTSEGNETSVNSLDIGTDGTMTCSASGTVCLDGFSYHICDRWY